MDKLEIRKQIGRILKEHKEDLAAESKRICNSIIAAEPYKNASTILAYMALPDEVDLSIVIKQALKDGKTVFLPHVYPNTSKMEFFQFTDTTPTVEGAFGIKEPQFTYDTPSFLSTNANKTNCLVLVPGRAFTKQGDRLGRGKGFYDIYLEPHKNSPTIKKAGICFPLQVLPELPTAPYDIKMDLLFF